VHTVDKYNTLHSAPRQLLVGFFCVLDFKIGSLLNLLSLFFCMRCGADCAADSAVWARSIFALLL
jgi:hypothetical protein